MRFRLAGLDPDVVERLRPFLDDLESLPGERPQAVLLFGSALTPDYLPGKSDVNVLLYRPMPERAYLHALFLLAWRHRPKRLAPPLLLTPEYLRGAMDATPIELFDLKLNHRCLYGEDFLDTLRISRAHLRLHCEHQLRRLYLHLQQMYVRVGGDPTELRELLRTGLVGYLAVFRALLFMLGAPLPTARQETILALGRKLELDVRAVQAVSDLRNRGVRVDVDELTGIYLGFYEFVGGLLFRVDRMGDEEAARG